MTIFEVSNRLMESAFEKIMSENLTFTILASSAFILTLAYLSKMVFQQQQLQNKDDGHVSKELHSHRVNAIYVLFNRSRAE